MSNESGVVRTDYKPRNWAKKVHQSKKRFQVIVAHRRAGKTTATVNHMIKKAIENTKEGARYAYIAPTYKQAKNVCWHMFKKHTRQAPCKINESELRIDFEHNGARIQLLGAENPDSLRGLGLDGVIFDEYSQQPANIFTEVVSKCLADKRGWAIWIGTPQGRNEFYKVYQYSINITDPEWEDGLFLTVDDSFRDETGETIENLKLAVEDDRRLVKESLMTEDAFNQEWYCSFDAAIKGAYYAKELAKARKEKRVTQVSYKPEIRVDTYWDLGISDDTCIIFAQTIGREVHIIDFYYCNGMALNHYIDVLDKRGYLYGTHNFPHDIKVTEMQTGRSRYEMVLALLDPHQKGLIQTVPNLRLEEGINATRAFFQRCWFNEDKCSHLLDALGSYAPEWDENKGIFRDKPKHNWASHPSDTMRMLAVGYRDKLTIKHHDVGMSKYAPRKPGQCKVKAVWD